MARERGGSQSFAGVGSAVELWMCVCVFLCMHADVGLYSCYNYHLLIYSSPDISSDAPD